MGSIVFFVSHYPIYGGRRPGINSATERDEIVKYGFRFDHPIPLPAMCDRKPHKRSRNVYIRLIRTRFSYISTVRSVPRSKQSRKLFLRVAVHGLSTFFVLTPRGYAQNFYRPQTRV